LFGLTIGIANGQAFKSDIRPLIDAACIQCHDANTQTGLNLEKLDHDLSDPANFRQWERVFDRVHAGEMPPESEDRPESKLVDAALDALRTKLKAASLSRQAAVGRVPARRLTKLEYGYTLRDLLKIVGDVTSGIPDEVESGTFDTVGVNQRISAVHMQSYLQAADEALDRAIQLGQNPYQEQMVDFEGSAFLKSFHHKPLNLGGSVSRQIENGVVLFRDVDYLLNSLNNGHNIPSAGSYRIATTVGAYQTDKPLTFKLLLKQQNGSTAVLTSVDLEPGEPQEIEVETFLRPGDAFYLTFVDGGGSVFAGLAGAGGSKTYKGPGLAVYETKVVGPLADEWPPRSAKLLLRGMPLKKTAGGSYKPQLSEKPDTHVRTAIESLASRVFRRPVGEEELESFLALADPVLAADRSVADAIRLPLRSILTSPQFLMFDRTPGPLDGYALANRLSYFIWKTLPDKELFDLAEKRTLADPQVLAAQVDRMLEDERSQRFVKDFLGQWLLLDKINATNPDEKLYPEYDELLGVALRTEPELFFTELISRNLSLTNLIDSDFTFVNRRLAEHYGIKGIRGQEFQKVTLPEGSPRGGVLTQAGILKTTANGTTTSPVTRGNFVLTNILGTPPSPPPPSVGSIEPDTRGKTTIREILAAHRDTETCNKCHREIDPPGFALESFDPIGGFRTRYRANASGFATFFGGGKTYKDGKPVDSSGVTADGEKFSGIDEFKQQLMKRKRQVAKHFISQLIVYSTGAEIQFADRDELETLVRTADENSFRVRDIIHSVVRSQIFRNN
jgi:hypothetical protein